MESAAIVSTISALRDDPFNKSRLLELHRETKHHQCVVDLGSKRRKQSGSFPEPSQLRPILLRDLEEDVIHHGRVIYGTLCVHPVRVDGVMSILEQAEGGGLAARVLIQGDWSKRNYAAGKEVAILEPCFRRAADGILQIVVDDPSSMLEVAATEDYAAADALKTDGNRSFGLRNWAKATDLYTQCIEMCEMALSRRDGEALKMAVLLPAFSNRAEAYLRLGDFDHALADSNKALAVDAGHVKSIFRKARALEGLQEFEKAVAWMEKVVPCNQAMLAVLKTCDRQSKTGEYDINGFLQGTEQPPKCADFVGPVEMNHIQNDYTGRGVGLFATNDVKVGELLLVSNPLAWGDFDRSSEFACSAIVYPTIQAAERSSRATNQIKFLLDLPEGKTLDVFRANNGIVLGDMLECKPRRAFTLSEVEKVIKRHSLTSDMTYAIFPGCGLWVLPSLMRHSCLSNVSLLQVGDAMFAHAARDIKAGEELNISYFSSLLPYNLRLVLLDRLGFACRCKRCVLETSLDAFLHKLDREYYAEGAESSRFAGELIATLENKLLYVSGNQHKSWLRASYTFVYLTAISDMEFLLNTQERVTTAEEVLGFMEATCPGTKTSMSLMAKKVEALMVLGRGVEHGNGLEGKLVDEEQVMQVHKATFGNRKGDLKDVLRVWQQYTPMNSRDLVPSVFPRMW